tara:strand:+ start:6174 stop:6476 length:303 start_codon:yes stop_codon:yes gene_type:complete
MDLRRNNGGVRENAGRKKKSDELRLISRLDSIIDSNEAIEVLKEMILVERDIQALKIYMSYRFGNPSSKIELETTTIEIPTITFMSTAEMKEKAKLNINN